LGPLLDGLDVHLQVVLERAGHPADLGAHGLWEALLPGHEAEVPERVERGVEPELVAVDHVAPRLGRLGAVADEAVHKPHLQSFVPLVHLQLLHPHLVPEDPERRRLVEAAEHVSDLRDGLHGGLIEADGVHDVVHVGHALFPQRLEVAVDLGHHLVELDLLLARVVPRVLPEQRGQVVPPLSCQTLLDVLEKVLVGQLDLRLELVDQVVGRWPLVAQRVPLGVHALGRRSHLHQQEMRARGVERGRVGLERQLVLSDLRIAMVADGPEGGADLSDQVLPGRRDGRGLEDVVQAFARVEGVVQ